MGIFWATLSLALLVFYLLVIARLIVEMTRSFARSWVPAGGTAVALEVVFVVTDPPLKALRRAIPPVRLGGVSIDLSVWILFIIIWVLQVIVTGLAAPYGGV